ncbi:MAG: hypothetical protein WCS73_10520, partial [Lentisphaeria bacterium]
ARKFHPTPRNLTEDKVETELFNVCIVTVAGGHEANGRCRIIGIAYRWQFGISILLADISIEQFFYKRKTVLQVDFFRT